MNPSINFNWSRYVAFALIVAFPGLFTSAWSSNAWSRLRLRPSSGQQVELALPAVSETVESQEKKRDLSMVLQWASENGVKISGLVLQETDTSDGCFGVKTSTDTLAMTNVLRVPSSLIFSSDRVRCELESQFGEDILPAIEYIESTQYRSQLSQFFLFVKVLMEHEKGEKSFWFPWFQALPRTFDTAIAMSELELEWLPPFAWALANVERKHLVVFRDALQKLPNRVLPGGAKNDDAMTKWAFQVVFTRAWRYPEEEAISKLSSGQKGYERCDIVPLGDMFNHCSEKDLELDYDDEDNFLAYTAHDVKADAPLHISYGRPTNPYRFLVIFGFCDTGMPEIFSQITLETPTERHQELGYDIDTMVFRSKDGAIANAVWDVLLFSILEQKPEIQERFYSAHVEGDTKTKKEIHELFHLETCLTLKSHVDRTYGEMKEILHKMDGATDLEKKTNHRYDLIRRNNEFVAGVFAMVKQRVDGMIQTEVMHRRNQS